MPAGLELPPDSSKPGPALPDDPQPLAFGTLATLTLAPVATTPVATTTSPPSPGPSPDSNSNVKTAQNTEAERAQAQNQHAKTIRARLVVAADGARSATREAAELRTVRMAYSQRGVVATVSTPMHHSVAWQRFLATGPLALLPTRCYILAIPYRQ